MTRAQRRRSACASAAQPLEAVHGAAGAAPDCTACGGAGIDACGAPDGDAVAADNGSVDTDGFDVDALDGLFKGFADPTRLRLLNVLVAGELCVCDLVDLLGLSQPTVSRHLAYLRRAGLVEVTRDWKFAHYRLAAPASAVHATLLACVRSCFTGVPPLDAERHVAERRVRDRDAAPCD